MKYNQIVVFLMGCCLTACESFFLQPATKKEEEILQERVLALNAIFSTGEDTLVAQIHWVASPLEINTWDYNSEFETVTEALVFLSDETSSLEMVYHEASDGFILPQSALPLLEGQSYTLTAKVGEMQMSATTTVPHFNIAPTVTFDKENELMIANIEWTDPADEENYYSLYGAGMNTETQEYLRGDLVYNEVDFICGMMSDSRRNGKKFEHTMYFYNPYGETSYENTELWVNIFHLSEDYYLYQEDVCNYYGDSPFQEPSPIHSNIEGGVGIFAINAVRTFEN